tara:strand:+ start:424 stop:606 length:183 start_codon:yes stop_codon:yes gene_type:complete
MSKPEHNEKNIHLLAEEVTDGMDMKTMISIIYELNVEHYEKDKDMFEEDWDAHCMEGEDE